LVRPGAKTLRGFLHTYDQKWTPKNLPRFRPPWRCNTLRPALLGYSYVFKTIYNVSLLFPLCSDLLSFMETLPLIYHRERAFYNKLLTSPQGTGPCSPEEGKGRGSCHAPQAVSTCPSGPTASGLSAGAVDKTAHMAQGRRAPQRSPPVRCQVFFRIGRCEPACFPSFSTPTGRRPPPPACFAFNAPASSRKLRRTLQAAH
jgi:hypothetical protein